MAHDANGDLENAVADWDAAIALDPTSDGYIQRAKVHQALLDEAAAEADYTNAIKLAASIALPHAVKTGLPVFMIGTLWAAHSSSPPVTQPRIYSSTLNHKKGMGIYGFSFSRAVRGPALWLG